MEEFYYVLLQGGKPTDMGKVNTADLLYGFKKTRLPGYENLGYERGDGKYIIHNKDLENYYYENNNKCFYAIIEGKVPEASATDIFSVKVFDSIHPTALVEWVPKNDKTKA